MNIGSLCRATLVAMIAALWLTGCASRVHSPYLPGLEAPRLVPAAVSTSRFDQTTARPRPAIRDAGETGDYWIRSLTLPSVGENGQDGNLVTARYYKGKGLGAKPLVIILPIWGKYTFPSNTLADLVMERSRGHVDLLQVLGENTLFDWEGTAEAPNEAVFLAEMDRMVGRMVNTVVDLRHLVGWARKQPGIDPDRIAMVGFSIGAIVTSLTLAHEPRLGAGALVMGGADLHLALSSCGGRLGSMREAITERFGWTVEEYRDKIEALLAPINPARHPGKIDPRRILIVEAAHDTCLPEPGRERLWQAMGRPERISYLYDHKMAFMSMTFLGGNNLQEQVYGFFERVFQPERPGVRYEVERPGESFADN